MTKTSKFEDLLNFDQPPHIYILTKNIVYAKIQTFKI
jgi:hypothetical protein